MITRKQFMMFCYNHNIKYNVNAVDQASRYFVKYKDAKDPNLDKSLVHPADTFIYVSFTGKDYDETNYLYKPYEKLYESTKPDECGVYGYESYGDIHIPEPIHCYEDDELRCLFANKNLSNRNVIDTTIPYNTLYQLEHLYQKFNQFTKNVKDFYYGETFQQAIQTYKNNIKIINELKLANENLVKKTLQIVNRKQELSEDFTKDNNI